MPETKSEEVHVPEDFKTLKEAYARIEQSNGALTTIVLGPGDHVVEEDEDGYNYLEIKCPVNIVGSRDVLDKSKIVVVGGFHITANGVHVEHLTICHKARYGSGVYGNYSFTLKDLTIENCGGWGVYSNGSGASVTCCDVVIRNCEKNGVISLPRDNVVKCYNVKISDCKMSGVLAHLGGTIILKGENTLITNNCLKGRSDDYGLNVGGSSSKINIVLPLTKEAISKGNNGGGNWKTDFDPWDGKLEDNIKEIKEKDDNDETTFKCGGGKCRRRKKQFRKTKTKRKKKSKRRRKTRKSKKRHKKRRKSKKRRKTKKK